MGCGSKPIVPFWGRCTTHFSLFRWGLGCSLGVRCFDPQPCLSSFCANARPCPRAQHPQHNCFAHFLRVSTFLGSIPLCGQIPKCLNPGVFTFGGYQPPLGVGLLAGLWSVYTQHGCTILCHLPEIPTLDDDLPQPEILGTISGFRRKPCRSRASGFWRRF